MLAARQQLRLEPPLDVQARATGRSTCRRLRFLLVSLVALGFNLIVLTLLVEGGGVEKFAAQAIALAASTPLNFLGNKLWSFRADLYSEPSPPQEK